MALVDQPLPWSKLSRLRFKATAVLSGVVLVVSGLSASLYIRVASRVIHEQAASHVREVSKTLAISSSGPMMADDRMALLEVAEELIRSEGLQYIAFADPVGRILAGAQQGQGQLSRLLYNDGVTIPIAPLDEPLSIENGDNGPRLDNTYPVFVPGEAASDDVPQHVVGYVRIGLSMADAEQNLNTLARQAVWIACLIAFLMVPLSYGLANRLASPLKRLSAASAALASGNLGHRVRLNRCDEIGDLARSFNAMADDLSRSHNALVSLNAELEDRVLARTFQLTEVNRRLQDAVAEKEDFVRAVSHDLSAPLRNVTGMIDLLRDRQAQGLSSTALDLLGRIRNNVTHGLEMIEELLDLSRIRSRRDAMQRVDLDAEVRSVAAQFEFDLQSKGIELSIESPLPVVWAERLRMRQLWQNLIDNAIKYTDTSRADAGRGRPRIRIWWNDQHDTLEFRVADNGIGIAPRDRERVFYVFRRAKDGFVARTAGKGVGLATCKSIVQNYNGRMWIEANPAGGSVFCFALAKDRLVPPAPGRGDEEKNAALRAEEEAVACP